MSLRTCAVLLALLLVTWSCDGSNDLSEESSTTSDDTSSTTLGDAAESPTLPVHSLLIEDGVAAGELQAVLVFENGCLLLRRESAEPLLAVWPAGTTFADNTVEFGAQKVRLDEEYVFGGGEVSSAAPALASTQLPDSCTYGGLWLISE